MERLKGVLCWAAPTAVPLSLTDRGSRAGCGPRVPTGAQNPAPPAPQAARIPVTHTLGEQRLLQPACRLPSVLYPCRRHSLLPRCSHPWSFTPSHLRAPALLLCMARPLGPGPPSRPPHPDCRSPVPSERPPSPPAAAPPLPVARCGGCGAGARGSGEGRGRPQRRAGPGGRCVARGPQAVPPGAVPAGAARAPPARAAGSCGPRRRRTKRSGGPARPRTAAAAGRCRRIRRGAGGAGRCGVGMRGRSARGMQPCPGLHGG